MFQRTGLLLRSTRSVLMNSVRNLSAARHRGGFAGTVSIETHNFICLN